MKHCLIALSTLLVAASAFAGSTLQLNNRNAGTGLDAPVKYAGANAAGADFMVALYAGPAGTAEGALSLVGAALPFRTGAGAGYINTTGVDTTREVPGTTDGATVAVQLRAWKVSAGATYEAALAAGLGGVGKSAVLSIAGGGGLTPPSLLAGLTGFDISPVVPEPGVAALGLLGAGLLAIRRKK